MNSFRSSRHLQFSRGFSLIELMVSLTIGLIIAIAAMSAYLGASGSSKVADAQARMNEDAQTALKILAQNIRLAGTNPDQSGRAVGSAFLRNPVYVYTYVGGSSTLNTPATSYAPAYATVSYSIRGCNGTFDNITSSTSLDLLTCTTTGTTATHSIAVNYEADQYNTVQSGGAPTDCLGKNTLTSTVATFTGGPATFYLADNRFYIDSSSGIPSLYCKGIATASAEPLVENVEDMKFQYGLATSGAAPTATVAGYLQANDATFTGAADWGRVLTVRICIVVRSEKPILSQGQSQAYYDCTDNLNTSQTDLRLRHAYYSTVVLRNRRY